MKISVHNPSRYVRVSQKVKFHLFSLLGQGTVHNSKKITEYIKEQYIMTATIISRINSVKKQFKNYLVYCSWAHHP